MQPTMQFKIHGMDCAEEVIVLKREIGPLVGGEDRLAFDLLNSKMTVAAGPGEVAPEAILLAVAGTGMRAEVWREEAKAVAEERAFWQRWGRTLLTAASGLCTLAGFICAAVLAGELVSHPVPSAAQVLYGLGILSGVWLVLPKAWLAARRLRPDMNLLMTVAVVGAVAIGDWFEASTVTFLFALSLSLESWSVGRARRAIAALLDLTPPIARLLRAGGTEQQVPVEQVAVGALLLVKPGERFPLDGRVVRGASHVNQAPITGESVPVLKNSGDPVFAGTVNGEGALEIESTKPAGDTTLAHIIRLVGEAHARRAPSEQWVEHFARLYTPIVLVLAVAFAVVPPLFGGVWSDWFYRALVLLVIACPCALVISTPVSIVAALAAAARQGVLLKGGVFVEMPGRLRAVAFDKTGTLTEGKPAVVEIVPLNDHDEKALLERAAGLEARSEHPLGRAVVEFAQEQGVPIRPADDFQIVPGKGATGRWDGRLYWLGSHRYLEERGQETEDVHQKLEAMSGAGRSVVVVGNEHHVCGLIALADPVRPEAKPALQALRQAGVQRIVLLTGDNEATAKAVAPEIGVDDVRAELLPAEKVEAVEALTREFGTVAMVGDGVNDAPALARATVGVAMGAAGSDAAIETADIALMSDDLRGGSAALPYQNRPRTPLTRPELAYTIILTVREPDDHGQADDHQR